MKLRMPGMAIRSSLAARVIRCISVDDVPGWATQCIRKSRSLKCGSSACPRVGMTARASTSSTPVPAYTRPGRRMIFPSRPV